ncbi:MAG: hypothetical protein WCG27_03260 [Pseudomonadota bacterium]
MNIKKFPTHFVFPEGASAGLAVKAITAIYNSKNAASLIPYVGALDIYFCQSQDQRPLKDDLVTLAVEKLIHNTCVVKKSATTICDVLIVGGASRSHEIRFLTNIARGLMASGLCLGFMTSRDSDEEKQLMGLRPMNGQSPIELIDLFELPQGQDLISFQLEVTTMAIKDLKSLFSLIDPLQISLSYGAANEIATVALLKCAWTQRRNFIKFSHLITRNNWSPLGAIIASEGLHQLKTILTFQHSVISTPAGYTPILANHYICYGHPSEELLKTLEASWERPLSRPLHFHCGGAVWDDIPRIMPDQFHKKTLLVIDQFSEWAKNYYGLHEDFESLFHTVEDLAESLPLIKQIRIRLHPDNPEDPRWHRLAKKWPQKVLISSSHVRPEEDLIESSMAIGLFSTALISACRWGIPAIPLWEEGRYYTPDLRALYTAFATPPDEVRPLILDYFTHNERYSVACAEALNVGRQYFSQRLPFEFSPQQITQFFPKIKAAS